MITGEDFPASVIHLIAREIARPPADIVVDMAELVRAVLGSTICLLDKAAALASIPTRNQKEIDAMKRVFRWERIRWSGDVLPNGVWPLLCKDSAQNWLVAMVLADHYAGTRFMTAEEEQAYLRQMLRKKYEIEKSHWAEEALAVDSALVQHVYRHFKGGQQQIVCEVPHAI